MTGVSYYYDRGHIPVAPTNTTSAKDAPDARGMRQVCCYYFRRVRLSPSELAPARRRKKVEPALCLTY